MILLLLLSLFALTNAGDVCDICDETTTLKWPNAVLTTSGTTCSGMSNDMANMAPGSSDCDQHIGYWRDVCCSGDKPQDVQVSVSVAPTPTPNMGRIGTSGNSVCQVCLYGGEPASKSMMINMLYIGADTCTNYYAAGLRGQIPDHLCDPLRYFAFEPCQCPPKNGNNQAPPGNSQGSSPGASPVEARKTPDLGEDKENVKLSNQRGGAGGGFHRRRGLKGKIHVKRD